MQILGRLGQGVSAVVYDGMYSDPATELEQRVALKVLLRPRLCCSCLGLTPFPLQVMKVDGMHNNWKHVVREISLFARLQHPNIIPIIGVGMFLVAFTRAILYHLYSCIQPERCGCCATVHA